MLLWKQLLNCMIKIVMLAIITRKEDQPWITKGIKNACKKKKKNYIDSLLKQNRRGGNPVQEV